MPNKIYNGQNNPVVGLGSNGDYYLNSADFKLYKKNSGNWVYLSTMSGSDWLTLLILTGGLVYHGTNNPVDNFGSDGDFFINTSSFNIFGPKTGGSWPSGVSLIGPTGAQGNAGATGPQGPAGVANPGGNNALLQYNNAGNFGGISNVKSDGTNIIRTADNSTLVWNNDVKGGASDLAARLSTISNFASPNAGGIITGFFYDNNPCGGVGTLAGVANRIDLAPYYTSVPLAIDQIGVAVSTAVAASQIKIVIYSSNANGWPDTLLYESAAISTASTGYAFVALTFTFLSGVQYWVGIRHSSTATLRTIAVANAFNLGLGNSGASSNQATILRRTLNFATAAPSSWSFVSTDLVNNVTPPSIRFRAV